MTLVELTAQANGKSAWYQDLYFDLSTQACEVEVKHVLKPLVWIVLEADDIGQ